MKINKLIKALEKAKEKYGNLNVSINLDDDSFIDEYMDTTKVKCKKVKNSEDSCRWPGKESIEVLIKADHIRGCW